MPVTFVKGDLFLSEAQTIAHGVNCQGLMGAGIARAFRSRFPDMFKEYELLCKGGHLWPGDYMLWKSSTPWVLNLATQNAIGPNAKLGFTIDVLSRVALNWRLEGITSVAMPRIGCGIGGLKWGEVKDVIVECFGHSKLPVTVYEEYVTGGKSACKFA